MNNLSRPGQPPQCALQVARLAGAQSELGHELSQAKSFRGMFLKEFQKFGGGKKVAHWIGILSLSSDARRIINFLTHGLSQNLRGMRLLKRSVEGELRFCLRSHCSCVNFLPP